MCILIEDFANDGKRYLYEIYADVRWASKVLVTARGIKSAAATISLT
jgi:hypothetical protein